MFEYISDIFTTQLLFLSLDLVIKIFDLKIKYLSIIIRSLFIYYISGVYGDSILNNNDFYNGIIAGVIIGFIIPSFIGVLVKTFRETIWVKENKFGYEYYDD